jgi:hypothetical protein
VGALIWLGLRIAGLPNPLLWAVLAGGLRFVPYVGIWIAALCAVLLAAAVDPGWSLALTTIGLFVAVELIASQAVEPKLYGHTTGLSPLSVVIAAIFWSWLWGPIGLVLSTPLTLCLLVAGLHLPGLNLFHILLGDAQALTLPQRFYQRALSGDSAEIIAAAKQFLKRGSFASYAERVLLPALHLARIDFEAGTIQAGQQLQVRSAIVAALSALSTEGRRPSRDPRNASVLEDANIGRLLRQQREQLLGRWQGPLSVPPGSLLLCVSLGSMADDLATELLVRILRDQKLDARHVSLADMAEAPPEAGSVESIAIVYIVSAFPNEERARAKPAVEAMRLRFPAARIVAVLLPGLLPGSDPERAPETGADQSAMSLGEAAQVGLDLHQLRAPPASTP